MPTACLAWATVVILPATGATTRPDVGTTANPSPRILAAKVSSGTSVIGLMAPFTGASTALSAAFTLGAGQRQRGLPSRFWGTTTDDGLAIQGGQSVSHGLHLRADDDLDVLLVDHLDTGDASLADGVDVDLRGIHDAHAQTGDAVLDFGDVVVTAQSGVQLAGEVGVLVTGGRGRGIERCGGGIVVIVIATARVFMLNFLIMKSNTK